MDGRVTPEEKSWVWKIAHYTVIALSSRPAMILTVICTAYWWHSEPDWQSRSDATLAGIAGLLAQTIVRDGRPRDKFLVKELQDIDDKLVEIHEDIKNGR